MVEFKKGMKCIVHNPIYDNYDKGTIVTLVKDFKDLKYWTIKEGDIGVAYKEMKPYEITNWKEVFENGGIH